MRLRSTDGLRGGKAYSLPEMPFCNRLHIPEVCEQAVDDAKVSALSNLVLFGTYQHKHGRNRPRSRHDYEIKTMQFASKVKVYRSIGRVTRENSAALASPLFSGNLAVRSRELGELRRCTNGKLFKDAEGDARAGRGRRGVGGSAALHGRGVQERVPPTEPRRRPRAGQGGLPQLGDLLGAGPAGAQFFQMLGNLASSITKAVSDSMERARQTTTSRASFSSSSLPAPAATHDSGSSGSTGFTVVKSFNKKIIPHTSDH
nr:uncharacterized protein LOC113804667 [Penaeus vannamei]